MMLSYFFGQSHLAEVDKKWAPMPISCNKRKVILLVKKSCQIFCSDVWKKRFYIIIYACAGVMDCYHPTGLIALVEQQIL